MPPSEEQDLDEIRHAAFELRQTDPSESVRILRRFVKRGGEVEALAHGALAEILLDDFDDVDGAIHHFQRLLKLAPGMPAGELGLARAYGRNGEVIPAQQAYGRALAGFEKLARSAMGAPAEEREGVDETILTTLELSVEEREFLHEADESRKPQTQPGAEILQWAETERIFDPAEEDEDDLDDWIRYAQLRAVLASLDGKRDEALGHIDRIAKLVPLPAGEVLRLRSFAHEAAHDDASAAEEALQAVKASGENLNPDDAFRAADLLTNVERPADAQALLRQLQQWLQNSPLPAELREEMLGQAEERLKDLAPAGLVSLGLRKKAEK